MDDRRFDSLTRQLGRSTSRRQVLRLLAGVVAGSLFGRVGRSPAARAHEPAPQIVPANSAFQRTWDRTDKPIVEGRATRTWIWGPEPFTGALTEPYAESPGGVRTVQYFDKSRMEITHPGGDQNSPWYVTNGLLVVEMATGQMQTGDARFEARQPAQVNVAGDADDPTGPTYATIGGLRSRPARSPGTTITERVDRAGTVTSDPSLAQYGVTAVQRVTVPDLDHTVAAPFWTFMNAVGTVYENGQYVSAPLFSDPYYATGLPITEAYWANVKVAGGYRNVLLQCFERRCLTYTPQNPPEWQIEMGNVGRHYNAWRTSGPSVVDIQVGPASAQVEQQLVTAAGASPEVNALQGHLEGLGLDEVDQEAVQLGGGTESDAALFAGYQGDPEDPIQGTIGYAQLEGGTSLAYGLVTDRVGLPLYSIYVGQNGQIVPVYPSPDFQPASLALAAGLGGRRERAALGSRHHQMFAQANSTDTPCDTCVSRCRGTTVAQAIIKSCEAVAMAICVPAARRGSSYEERMLDYLRCTGDVIYGCQLGQGLDCDAVCESECSKGCAQCGTTSRTNYCCADQDRCTNLEKDRNNCGGCGAAYRCNPDSDCCNGTCTPVVSNDLHCGYCGNSCDGGWHCCERECIDYQTDRLHCGGCGIQCPSGYSCQGGNCVDACGGCLSGTECCGTTCVDTSTSNQHCGACNRSCAAGTHCQVGQCVSDGCGGGPPCQSWELCCSGQCVDPRWTRQHCGACGNACLSTEVCENSICVPQCGPSRPCPSCQECSNGTCLPCEEGCCSDGTCVVAGTCCGQVCGSDFRCDGCPSYCCGGGYCYTPGTCCPQWTPCPGVGEPPCCGGQYPTCAGGQGGALCCPSGLPVSCPDNWCCPPGSYCGGFHECLSDNGIPVEVAGLHSGAKGTTDAIG